MKDRERWYKESDFPHWKDYESTTEYGDVVYMAIINRFNRKHGGQISETFETEAKTFGHLWAYIQAENKLLITESDVDFFTETVTDAEADFIFENNANRVIGLLSAFGYRPTDTGYVIEDLHWAETGEFLIKTDLIPSLDEVRSEILDGYILPRNAILEYAETIVRDRLKSLGVTVEARFESQHIGLTAAIEHKLNNRGWLTLKVPSDDDRVWVESDGVFNNLVPDSGEADKIPEEELFDLIHDYLEGELGIGQYVSGNLVLDRLVRSFEKKLRGDGWGEVAHQGNSTWYTNEDAHKEALQSLDDDYRATLESPNPRFGSLEEMKKSRGLTYEFYNENSIQLRKFEIVDGEGEFDRKLRLLKAYRHSADQWERLDGAETAGGKWVLHFDEPDEKASS